MVKRSLAIYEKAFGVRSSQAAAGVYNVACVQALAGDRTAALDSYAMPSAAAIPAGIPGQTLTSYQFAVTPGSRSSS